MKANVIQILIVSKIIVQLQVKTFVNITNVNQVLKILPKTLLVLINTNQNVILLLIVKITPVQQSMTKYAKSKTVKMDTQKKN